MLNDVVVQCSLLFFYIQQSYIRIYVATSKINKCAVIIIKIVSDSIIINSNNNSNSS